MKITGIIAEYNPFHNGHLYHLEKTRRETKADYLVIVMSGDFTQRGAPALADKFTRAQMALLCGADLVLELPVVYATGSAPYFARGAVALLDNLQVVDCLCFGSEANRLDALLKVGRILRQELPAFQKSLRGFLSTGHTFPSARQQALAECLGNACEGISLPAGLLDSPNDILGLEYCMALQELNSPIRPFAIARRESAYHQTDLGEKYSSATAIRRSIVRGEPFSAWGGHLPAAAGELLQQNLEERGWLTEDDFSLLLKYKCMETPADELCRFFDVSKEMANRIKRRLNDFTSYRDFIVKIKTRQITYTRAARGLLHILLNLSPPSFWPSAPDLCPYARVLGFRREAAPLLSQIKKAGRAPLVTQPAKFLKNESLLSPQARSLLEQDIHAANLYESVRAYKTGRPFVHEARRSVIRL